MKLDKQQRGKKNTTSTVHYDLELESEYETKVSLVGMEGIKYNRCASSNLIIGEKKRE